ncbi:MAG TPA: SDR family NAD(P)-dependent oxidoreductase, partial [Burkholderiaceae bacterium]|nr:SDR family NAD(P)-dependent oxidoreductase [Burkholderiaceae bacterium]
MIKPLSERRVALVTGGRRGIGRAIAYELAEAGFDLQLNDLMDDEAADETLAGVRERGAQAHFMQGDIADLTFHTRL